MWGISLYLLTFVVVTCAKDDGNSNNPVIISLTQVEIPKYTQQYQQVAAKPKGRPKPKPHDRPPKGENLKFPPSNNYTYVGMITAGTPPQRLTVEFDLFSGTLWLGSSDICSHDETYCEMHRTYNNKNSKTYKDYGESISLFYGGLIRGELVQDNIGIQRINIKDQVFLEAKFIDNYTQQLGFDGIFGLFSSSEVHQSGDKPPVVPPIVNMINQNSLREPVFSIYLAKPNSKIQSALTLGGVDNHLYSDNFKFTPIFDGDYYWIKTDKILLDDKEFDGSYWTLTDLSTRGIAGPDELMEPLNEYINATLNDDDGFYYVDCDKVNELPTITFVINNYSFPMTGEEYVIQNFDNTNKCLSGLISIEGRFAVVYLGISFMQKYYLQFDLGQRRLGLATAK